MQQLNYIPATGIAVGGLVAAVVVVVGQVL